MTYASWSKAQVKLKKLAKANKNLSLWDFEQLVCKTKGLGIMTQTDILVAYAEAQGEI